MADADKPADSKRPFKRFDGPRLSAEEAARQGRATKLAIDALGAAAAIAFLNGDDAAIGGKPLAVAVQSEDGLQAVARRIAERAS